MRRLERLRRVNEYLSGFRIPDSGIVPLVAVSQADATGRLTGMSGDQLLIARPELHQGGDSDRCRDSISLAFFVLAKEYGPATTPESEDGMFRRLLDLADRVLSRVAEDSSSSVCGLLSGLSLTSADVVPEYSLFGGWSGWSIDVTLE